MLSETGKANENVQHAIEAKQAANKLLS